MKTIYLIYIVVNDDLLFNLLSSFVNIKLYDYNDDSNTFKGLYAWTTDKDIYEEFMLFRKGCNLYRPIKKTIDKDEYKQFKSQYKSLKLKRYKYCRGDYIPKPDERVVSTFDEHSFIYEDCCDFALMVDKGLFPDLIVDYTIMNDEIIDALDTLSYTTEYDSYYGGDPDYYRDDDSEIVDRESLAGYNKSFGLTIFCHPYVDITCDKFKLFLYVFQPLLI